MKLVLIRGLPGSGKSTLAKSLCDGNSTYYEADMYFVDDNGDYNYNPEWIGAAHAWCQRITDNQLDQGFNIIVSNTFTTLKELRPYFELALKYGILPTVILCQNQFGNIHDVPQESLDRMKNRFCFDISPLIKEYQDKLNSML